jgi:hypothetical protein
MSITSRRSTGVQVPDYSVCNGRSSGVVEHFGTPAWLRGPAALEQLITLARAIPYVMRMPPGVVTAPVFGAYRWPTS